MLCCIKQWRVRVRALTYRQSGGNVCSYNIELGKYDLGKKSSLEHTVRPWEHRTQGTWDLEDIGP